MTAVDGGWRGAARVYVRPDAHYAVREDRTASGPAVASATDSARIPWGRPDQLGGAVLSMLDRSVDGVELPIQIESAPLEPAFRQSLLELADLDSWERFAGEAMLISVRRFAGSSLRLSPMVRIPDRRWGFHPTGHMVEVGALPDGLGEAMESMAMSNGFGPR